MDPADLPPLMVKVDFASQAQASPLEPEGSGKERIREENTGTLLKENFEKGKRIKKWKEF